jgi:hypothetical protein
MDGRAGGAQKRPAWMPGPRWRSRLGAAQRIRRRRPLLMFMCIYMNISSGSRRKEPDMTDVEKKAISELVVKIKGLLQEASRRIEDSRRNNQDAANAVIRASHELDKLAGLLKSGSNNLDPGGRAG